MTPQQRREAITAIRDYCNESLKDGIGTGWLSRRDSPDIISALVNTCDTVHEQPEEYYLAQHNERVDRIVGLLLAHHNPMK